MRLKLPTAEIEYEIIGEDKPDSEWFTLVNGYSRPGKDFKTMAKFLSQKGARVLLFDNRGVGKTKSEMPFTFDEMVSDIVELWKALDIEKSHLLGVSMGGVIAQRAAVRFSSQVKKLYLVSTSPAYKYLKSTQDMPNQSAEVLKENLSKYYSEGFKKKSALLYNSLLKETTKTFQDEKLKKGLLVQRQAVSNFDFTSKLSTISVPTLILHGSEDKVILPEAAQVMAKNIPNNKLKILPGIGHLFLAECPKDFYELVTKFWKEVF
jgi:pimeloyl-ACP methyl ester carboxylesterase